MRNVFLYFLTIGVFASLAIQPAFGAILFDDRVRMNLTLAGYGSDLQNVTVLDISAGAGASPAGVVAVNGTDTNLDGVVSTGDRVRTVGHGTIVTAFQTGGSTAVLADAGLQITAIFRDWDSTVAGVTVVPSVLTAITTVYDAGSTPGLNASNDHQMPAGTGVLDIFVNTSDTYVPADVNQSVTGTWVATFAIGNVLAGANSTTFMFPVGANPIPASGTTNVGLLLVAQLGADTATEVDDFFVWEDDGVDDPLVGGSQLALATFVNSSETAIVDPPIVGINRTMADPGPVNIGANFDPPAAGDGINPANSNFPFDVVSRTDANAVFGVIPEPSSALAWAGLALLGAAYGAFRRRRMS